ncbi:PREDICTED: short-chain collagen C4-like isoform X2 [Amphimedon queenslandica]|uniref:Chitin-binding type-4 domain-containing protein n=1 Tax=Amphimedon queenslandica TaxID=400682 RepID=A0AAN0JKA9_AMPQE|nr:PREDICTED: short-chain collagen C4-like isoform X2 [Amphimedon queenslandica]|eukprot:XP_019857447.1 PREDICTED: short-chain collagen C4-like isoform X2 [Amphimedon queenslandica]
MNLLESLFILTILSIFVLSTTSKDENTFKGDQGEKWYKGDKGDKCDIGPVGPAGPKSGGAVYTRWGRKSCPAGAELVYEGLAAGGHYTHMGGGADHVCLPAKEPQNMKKPVPPRYSLIYGTEYENVNDIFPGKNNHNVPCAVCYAPNRSTKLMIPSRTSCPSLWTMEYKGYLMTSLSSHDNHNKNSLHECVDDNPESIDGSDANTDGALFYFILLRCIGTGIPCPPYAENEFVTCVVCTR